MNSEILYQQNTQIYSVCDKNGCVILEKNKKSYRKLNRTASAIWDYLKISRTEEQIVEYIFDQFDVSRDQAKTDVQDFLRKYQKLHFIQKTR